MHDENIDELFKGGKTLEQEVLSLLPPFSKNSQLGSQCDMWKHKYTVDNDVHDCFNTWTFRRRLQVRCSFSICSLLSNREVFTLSLLDCTDIICIGGKMWIPIKPLPLFILLLFHKIHGTQTKIQNGLNSINECHSYLIKKLFHIRLHPWNVTFHPVFEKKLLWFFYTTHSKQMNFQTIKQ